MMVSYQMLRNRPDVLPPLSIIVGDKFQIKPAKIVRVITDEVSPDLRYGLRKNWRAVQWVVLPLQRLDLRRSLTDDCVNS